MRRERLFFSGVVIHGAKLGRTLGYPTANLDPAGIPQGLEGIFAVWVCGRQLVAPIAGVASLGTRPTVNGSGRLLEIHLFDFAGNLYGQNLDVEFVARLRDELKFSDLPALQAQIELDATAARGILSRTPPRHFGRSMNSGD